MRGETDLTKIRRLMERLGEEAEGPGRVYVTGGTTALLFGWRVTTLDVDLKLDPEPAGIFAAIRRLKDELDINVELAAPDDFIPALPGWRERSPFIVSCGPVTFFHYDLYGQALAKIERGHTRDQGDLEEMLRRGLVVPAELWRLFEAIEPELDRFPALDPDAFREKASYALRGRS
jgi:hypothetical protein